LPSDGSPRLHPGQAPIELLALCLGGECYHHRIRRQALR